MANILLEVYENNEFYEFITGRHGYSIPERFGIATVPTDWTVAVPCVYRLYETTKDEGVITAFHEGIIKAIHGSGFDIWCACNTLFSCLYNESCGKATFLVDSEIFAEFRKVAMEKAETLRATYYNGYTGEQHVWQDICRLSKNCADEGWREFLLIPIQ